MLHTKSQGQGDMLNVLKMSQPLRVWQHLGVILNILTMSQPI